jgi:hypothetical protein
VAISFDESNDYYTISDNAALTLPDGDWCMGVWTYVSDNSGTAFQYSVSTNYVSNGTWFLYLVEDSASSFQGRWQVYVKDNSGNRMSGGSVSTNYLTSVSYGADSVWRLFVIQRSGSNFELYTCPLFGSVVSEDTASVASVGAIDSPSALNLGRRSDGNSARYYGGVLAEFFKGNFALTTGEIAALGQGLAITGLGKPVDVYYPMIRAEATLYDRYSGLAATRQDAPATVAHPPLIYPAQPYIMSVPAAGAPPVSDALPGRRMPRGVGRGILRGAL